MAEWVGAVDGGGSKTHGALLSSDGELLSLPADTGCNPLDNSDWAQVLDRMLGRFADHAQDANNIAMGMPGFGEVRHLADLVSEQITKHLGDRALIINDVEMAFHGAFPSGEGILLLAGTGSMAVARGPKGLVRVGGWGDLFGDEGSAYWIGRSALSLASRELDGRIPANGFAAALCAALELNCDEDPFALLNWVSRHQHVRSCIASVARNVDGMASAGHQEAQQLLNDAALLLAEHISAAATLAGLPSEARWAFAGSVFNSDTLKQNVEIACGQSATSAALPPLGGGLLLAARKSGWDFDPDFISELASQLAQSSPKRNS